MLHALIAVNSIGGNAGGTSSKAIVNSRDQAGFTCTATTVLDIIEPSITAECLRANRAPPDLVAQGSPDYEHLRLKQAGDTSCPASTKDGKSRTFGNTVRRTEG